MGVFNRYAQYYDLFYREKDYRREADYVDALIQKYGASRATAILDLGCGTGGHAVLLAQKGYRVTGVDRSAKMLAIAEEKSRQMQVSVELKRGDICTVDLNRRFDVAIAMFAVMGYQTTNEALESALLNVAKHLNPAGLLIFDAWFGPAVITQKPRDKILIIEQGSGSVIRLTRPNLDIISQIVDVNFTVLHVENDVILDRVDEMHKMRFFFAQELEFMFTKTGYRAVRMHPFMELEGELTENNWNMAVIARKVPVSK
jgi:SAM-dependent methyltransferase